MPSFKQLIASRTAQVFLCTVSVPTSVFIGLLLRGAISPDVELTGEFAGWMAIFVISIFIPAHLFAQAVVYLLAKNRFAFRRPLTTILASCALAAAAISFSQFNNPFSLVFSVVTIPFFLAAYVVASGRIGQRSDASSEPKPLRGST